MTPTDFFTAPLEQGPVGRSPLRYLDELPEPHRPRPLPLPQFPEVGRSHSPGTRSARSTGVPKSPLVAHTDPALLLDCPSCGTPLRMNPFLVDVTPWSLD